MPEELREIRIEITRMMSERELATIARAFDVPLGDVTYDHVRDYIQDAITTELINDEEMN